MIYIILNKCKVSWNIIYNPFPQTVRFNDVPADDSRMSNSGVSQGSILGPLVSLFSVNDLLTKTPLL